MDGLLKLGGCGLEVGEQSILDEEAGLKLELLPGTRYGQHIGAFLITSAGESVCSGLSLRIRTQCRRGTFLRTTHCSAGLSKVRTGVPGLYE